MKSIVPYTFRTGGIVDMESVNGNLRQMAQDVNRNLSRRYTYWQMVAPIAGMLSSDTEELRSFYFHSTLNINMSLVSVEAVIYAATGATWTVNITNGAFSDSFTVATAGTTTKASGALSRVFSMETAVFVSKPAWSPSGQTGIYITLSSSVASTIVSGYLVLHWRCDRGNGGDHSGYTPTLLQSTTSSAGSILDTQLTAFENAVLRDTNNNRDIRVELFVGRNFSSALTWAVPNGGGRTALFGRPFVVCTSGRSCNFAITAANQNVAGIGTTSIVSGTSILQNNGTDNPISAGSDTTVTFTPSGGTVELAYCTVIWR